MYLPTTYQRMTADEFAALPEGPPYFQLVEGELFFMAPPTLLHQDIVLNLAYAIKSHLRANPALGHVVVAPSDVKLDDENVFEPDVYLVSRERHGILTKQGASGAPDLVAEVLSPSTLRLDRAKKRDLYFRFGVRELWFVSPDSRRVEVHLPDTGGGPVRTLSAEETLTTDLLPGWSVPVAELFPSAQPRPGRKSLAHGVSRGYTCLETAQPRQGRKKTRLGGPWEARVFSYAPAGAGWRR